MLRPVAALGAGLVGALARPAGPGGPPDWTVLVRAELGLDARWLCRAIQQQGWHPCLRIHRGGRVCPHGRDAFVPLRAVLPVVGNAGCGPVICFVTHSRRLACTLTARWAGGHADPWLVVTDLSPAAANVAWYGVRAGIEQGFKDLKRGVRQWQRTRMTDLASPAAG